MEMRQRPALYDGDGGSGLDLASDSEDISSKGRRSPFHQLAIVGICCGSAFVVLMLAFHFYLIHAGPIQI